MTTGPGVVGLFADWRAATGRPSDTPASEADLEAFFAELPAAASTLARRRCHLEAAGVAPPRPPAPACRDVSGLDAALRAIRVGGWPDGLVGRRDAALLALSLAGGLHRSQLQALVVGGPLPDLPVADDHPSACPACALSRWVRTLLVAGDAGWAEVRYQLVELPADPASDADGHDCARALPVPRCPLRAIPLLSGIDRYGWVDETRPLSARAISAIVAARLAVVEERQDPGGTHGVSRRATVARSWQDTVRLRRDAARRLAEIDAMLDALGEDTPIG